MFVSASTYSNAYVLEEETIGKPRYGAQRQEN